MSQSKEIVSIFVWLQNHTKLYTDGWNVFTNMIFAVLFSFYKHYKPSTFFKIFYKLCFIYTLVASILELTFDYFIKIYFIAKDHEKDYEQTSGPNLKKV